MPREFQEAFGRREVVRTLRTTSKREADELALDVVKELDRAVKLSMETGHRDDCDDYYEPTHEQLEAAVREAYTSQVESDWEERSDPDHMALMGLGGKKSAKTYRKEAKRLRQAASVGDYSAADVDYWSDHFRFRFPENNVKRNRFRQLLAYAYAEVIERAAEHDLGDRSGEPIMPELRSPRMTVTTTPLPAQQAAPNVIEQTYAKAEVPKLEELWLSHVRQRGQGVKAATLTDRLVSVQLFAGYVGHEKSVAQITKEDARMLIVTEN